MNLSSYWSPMRPAFSRVVPQRKPFGSGWPSSGHQQRDQRCAGNNRAGRRTSTRSSSSAPSALPPPANPAVPAGAVCRVWAELRERGAAVAGQGHHRSQGCAQGAGDDQRGGFPANLRQPRGQEGREVAPPPAAVGTSEGGGLRGPGPKTQSGEEGRGRVWVSTWTRSRLQPVLESQCFRFPAV